MPKTRKIEGLTPLQHAREWQKLADEAERSDAKARERGDIFAYLPAAELRTLRSVAEVYRQLHRTGKRHCCCHLAPLDKCPKRVAHLRLTGELKL